MRSKSIKTSSLKAIAVLTILIAALNLSTLAQSSAAPPPAPERWRGLIGEYGTDKAIIYVLESDEKLCLSFSRAQPSCMLQLSTGVFQLPASGQHGKEVVIFSRDSKGHATQVKIGDAAYARRKIGPEEGAPQLHVDPVRPVPELIKEALAAQPPKETGDFRRSDLVELTRLDPTIKLDIRYATTNNFLGTVFYSEPRAFMQRPAAEAVVRVNRKLKQLGYGLLVHDAYRPWYITKVFWDATPVDKHIFVADPSQGSRHNRGCAVDLTLYALKTGKPVEMVSTYDETTDRAYPDYPGGTSLQRWHRKLLREAMESEGFTVYDAEWWHFDFEDWRHYGIGNVTFEKLETGAH